MGINQLAVKALKSPPTYRKEKKEGVNVHGTPIQDKNRLIHEHDFITVTTKEANNSFLVHCTTCDADYCGLCGKALHKPLSMRYRSNSLCLCYC
jgi:hypothetical protein